MTTSKTAVAMVQISTCSDAEGNISAHGVDRNGVVYEYRCFREPLAEPVQLPNGGTKTFNFVYCWVPLRMDFTKGPEPECAQ